MSRRRKNGRALSKLEPVSEPGLDVGVEARNDDEVAAESDLACNGATGDPPICSGGNGMGFAGSSDMVCGEAIEASSHQVHRDRARGGMQAEVVSALSPTATDLHLALT